MRTPSNFSHGRAWLLVAVLFLQACASSFDADINKTHQDTQARTSQAQTSVRQTQQHNPYVMLDRVPRFTQKSVPFVRSAMLPPHIGSVTLRYPGRHNLSTIAELISRTIDIPVIMTPDALMDPRVFVPARASASNTTTTNATPDAMQTAASLMMAAGASQIGLTHTQAQTTLELNYHGTLAGLLDQIAAKARLTWAYDNGRIVFQRVITRVISVKTLPGAVKSSGTLTMSGSSNSGSSSITSEIDVDFWAALDKALPLLISSQGQVQVDSRTGNITVRDAIDNVQAIERVVAQHNAQFMRQIALHVEVLQVDLSLDHQSGVDWSYVSQALPGLSDARVTLQGAPSLTTSGASMSMVLRDSSSSLSNGSVLFKALEKFGRVSTAYSSVLTTMNRQPVPVGVMNTTAYLKQTTPAVTTNAGSGTTFSAPGLTPGEISTGFTLTLLPMVLDSNRVLVQSALSISSLRELKSFSSGSGINQQTVQQPNVDTFVTLQRMGLIPGETMVLVGFEREESRSYQNDIVRNALPGSRSGTGAKTSTVILITPRLLDL